MQDLTGDQIAEARRLYAMGRTPHSVAEVMSRHKRQTVTGAQVRAVVELRKHGQAIDPELRRRAVELRQTGMTVKEIHARLGGNFRTVKSACSDVKLGRVRTHSEEALRRRRLREAARSKRRLLASQKRRPVPVPEPLEIEVPAWVPGHLYEFFEATAIKRDEFAAAAAVRALLRGGSVAHL